MISTNMHLSKISNTTRRALFLLRCSTPDTEIYWNSTHDKAGVGCAACHMPKVKNEKGETYTSHWATNPRAYVQETCLQCHKDKTEEHMTRVMDAQKALLHGQA